ncbi:carboxypeptidase-like regulatory domain-containing protein [Actinophytocola gossypii]|uniref:Carboxypeptidase regulatory-like domain-containing protein n=1 Tax=Actinophytocola gossypii TaxID=2812003 RepID=A0ABT2J3A2_9PSEU|nr:carboxypeptidase-like regulatory domain-containing protein [Actinophytocola gossypii]MCT2582327.1 carboxypeptidase regulatory-like domain-containing protein [Actinophytocola gossypii]
MRWLPGRRRHTDGAVQGVVVSASGQPLAGCMVGFRPTSSGNVHQLDYTGITGADGSYRLGLPAATYRISVNGRDRSDTLVWGEKADVTVVAGRTTIADIIAHEHPPTDEGSPRARFN